MEEHIVWFEDIRSFSEKYHLIDRYQLLGTTFWQLSLPFPQNWHFIDRNVAIQKYIYLNYINKLDLLEKVLFKIKSL